MQKADNRMVIVITREPEIAQIVSQQFDGVVEWIQNGKNALERLGETEPTLVVLDLQLSGFEILDYIRREGRLAAVRIVIIVEDVLCIHILGVEVEAELMKPVFPDDLIEVIGQLSLGLSNEVGPSASHTS